MTAFKSRLIARGNFLWEVRDAVTHAVIQKGEVANLITTVGRNMVRDALRSGTSPQLIRFAIGDTDTAPAATDTTLANELARYAFTSTSVDTGELTINYSLPSANLNGNTLKEAGLFDNAAGGNMYCRALILPTISKTAAIYVNFTWVLSFDV